MLESNTHWGERALGQHAASRHECCLHKHVLEMVQLCSKSYVMPMEATRSLAYELPCVQSCWRELNLALSRFNRSQNYCLVLKLCK